jgi:beta-glucanase (GH16 family)
MSAPADPRRPGLRGSVRKLLRCPRVILLTLPLLGQAAEPVWQDEFNQPVGSGPDASRWVYDLGHGHEGWGNAEKQRYTDLRANSVIIDDPQATDGKALVIRALEAAPGEYTSARLKTEGKFTVRHGRIEARLKLPYGQGIWPAFWMLGVRVHELGWPAGGEIDIMEMIGREPGTVHGTLHGPGYSGGGGISGKFTLPAGERLHEAYHVFAVEWSPGKIVWMLDGVPYLTRTAADLPAGSRWVFDDGPCFLLLNVAVGGHWPGYPDASTRFPQEMRIDYVRVYGARTTDSKPAE